MDIKKLIEMLQSELTNISIELKQDIIDSYTKNTFQYDANIIACLNPISTSDVQACMRVANKLNLVVFPISSGKNWGYGAVSESRRPGIVLNLSKLNHIVDFNEKLAYVVIQPGVTFQQLGEFLVNQQSNLMMSATGSSPETSIIANTLEKGIGSGSFGERSQYMCGLEVVLPSGECIQTSFGRFEGAAATHVNRSGIGPCMNGLFLQSNLGIVTQMTVWLKPIPEHMQMVSFALHDEAKLSGLLDCLQQIALYGYAETGYTIFNDYKMLMAKSQYPWDEANNETPLPESLKVKMKRKYSLPAWKGYFKLTSANAQIARHQKEHIKSLLEVHVDDLDVLTLAREESKKLLAENVSLKGDVRVCSDDKRLLRCLGINDGANIKTVYWRMRNQPAGELSPSVDNCGLLWVCPVIPFNGADIKDAINVISKLMLQHGYEPAISISIVSDKSVVLVVSIVYDKSIAEDGRKANQCKDELFSRLREYGYFPYRVPVNAMHLVRGDDPNYMRMLQDLKQVIDPLNVLAPNRYIA